MERRTVAVVEDEPLLAEAVAARLRSEGMEVEIALDGPSGVELCERLHPDLVVLDLMLPGLDGLEVCRRIQSERPTPVLVLTARDAETDLLVGLAIGADDYMTKPFSMRELVARVHALLRRADRAQAGADAVSRVLVVGPVQLDLDTRQARHDGVAVHLTPTEFDLAARLADRPGVVFTREQLLAEVWGYRDGSGARTVDSHIRAIRRKLGAGFVRTVHGVGYALQPAGDSARA